MPKLQRIAGTAIPTFPYPSVKSVHSVVLRPQTSALSLAKTFHPIHQEVIPLSL